MNERRVVRAALVLAWPCCALGCTFLIDFDEVPYSGDADVAPLARDGGGGGDGGPASDGSLGDSAACDGRADGLYCPGNQIVWEGDKDDLVACKAGAVAAVRHCARGVGCIRMRDGYPDQCDECPTKTDGVYCGRDMPGWESKNDNQRVRCQNGFQIELQLCAAGCLSKGATSSCK